MQPKSVRKRRIDALHCTLQSRTPSLIKKCVISIVSMVISVLPSVGSRSLTFRDETCAPGPDASLSEFAFGRETTAESKC